MVLEKDSHLAEVMGEFKKAKEELAIVKALMVETEAEVGVGDKAGVKAVRLYKKNFLRTSEYTRLATHFMEVRGDQLTEKVLVVHPEWDLSFLLSNLVATFALEP
ncbi:hypothetical protein Adt_14299 [Abeliophyllum distichum]|uniref:Uncharacterized protein n=1 Tax=Abeliophyllum distichum TaxID=126358 RepID=A0ABD1TZ88_9LAMI